jgi:hypothetical protein
MESTIAFQVLSLKSLPGVPDAGIKSEVCSELCSHFRAQGCLSDTITILPAVSCWKFQAAYRADLAFAG